MEQEPSKLEENLRAKISEIFKKSPSVRREKDLKFRSYVAQLGNELKKSKSKGGLKEISEDELKEISEYCRMLRRGLYNKNYQYIPLNLD